MKAIVTGSAGLVGSECTRTFCGRGWEVIGVDNDTRGWLFGPEGSTRRVAEDLVRSLESYRHRDLDIRDRDGIRALFRSEKPDLIVHTAGQPSHDKAASIPYDDFDVNAVGTLNVLVAARDYCPDAPFCFTSTNKVYGDHPNRLPTVDLERRYDFAPGISGVSETMSIDNCIHSVFGASKVAADVMCQEFGKSFHMPVGVFRAGCITGPLHAAVELHGYLAYIVACAAKRTPYRIFGYQGKQVRDQIHCRDLAALFLHFFKNPRPGEVYNVGGGRENSISILETIHLLRERGFDLEWTYDPSARHGDHICYITDLTKVCRDFPEWKIEVALEQMLDEILERHVGLSRGSRAARARSAPSLMLEEEVEPKA